MNSVDNIQEHFALSTKPLTGELESPSRRNPYKTDRTRVMLLGYNDNQVTVALRTALNFEDLFKATLSDNDGAPAFIAENGTGKIPLGSIANDATDNEVWSCGRIKEPKADKSVARLAFEKARDIRTLATLVTNIREVDDVDKVVNGLEDFKAKYFADPDNPITELKVEFGGYPQGLFGEVHRKTPEAAALAPAVAESVDAPLELHVGQSISGYSTVEEVEKSAAEAEPLIVKSAEVYHDGNPLPGYPIEDYSNDRGFWQRDSQESEPISDEATESPSQVDPIEDDLDPDRSMADDFDGGEYEAVTSQAGASFAEGLKAAMVKAPDIILAGEVKSIEDVVNALSESDSNKTQADPEESTQVEVLAEGTGTTQNVESLPKDAAVIDLSDPPSANLDPLQLLDAEPEQPVHENEPEQEGADEDGVDPLDLLDGQDDYPESDGDDDDDDPVEPPHFQLQEVWKEAHPSVGAYIEEVADQITPENLFIAGSDPTNNTSVFLSSDDGDDDPAEPEAKPQEADAVTEDHEDEGFFQSDEEAGQEPSAAEPEAAQPVTEAATEQESEELRPSFMDFLDSLGEAKQESAGEEPKEVEPVNLFAWLEANDDEPHKDSEDANKQ